MFYVRISSVWDSLLDFLGCYYKTDFKRDLKYNEKLLKWLKNHQPEISKTISDFYEKDTRKLATKYRIFAAHGSSIGIIRNYVKEYNNELVDFPNFDKDGNVLRNENGDIVYQKQLSKKIVYSLGEYISSKVLMQNMDDVVEETGNLLYIVTRCIKESTTNKKNNPAHSKL